MVKKDKAYKEKMEQRREKQQTTSHIRTKEERRHETLNIIYQMKQNNITSEYDATKQLIMKLNEYVNKEETIEFTIPFPEKNKLIKGTLPIMRNEEPVVVLKQLV